MHHWEAALNIAGRELVFNMDTLLTMWFTMGILIAIALLTRRNLSLVPTKLQAAGEGIINYFVDIAKSNLDEKEAMKHQAQDNGQHRRKEPFAIPCLFFLHPF